MREFYISSHAEESFKVIEGFCHDFVQAKLEEEQEIIEKTKELKANLEQAKSELERAKTSLRDVEDFTERQANYIEKLKEKETEGEQAIQQLERETFQEQQRLESELIKNGKFMGQEIENAQKQIRKLEHNTGVKISFENLNHGFSSAELGYAQDIMHDISELDATLNHQEALKDLNEQVVNTINSSPITIQWRDDSCGKNQFRELLVDNFSAMHDCQEYLKILLQNRTVSKAQ